MLNLKIMKNLTLALLLFAIFFAGCKKDESDQPPAGPDYQIGTGTVTGITNKSATVTGSISNLKGKNIISCGHVWSTSHSPTTALTTKTTFGPVKSDTSFTSNLSMLQQGTVYYVRAYTTDSEGTFYGGETTFTTAASFFEFVVSSTYLTDNSYQKERCWVMIYSMQKQLIGVKEIFKGHTYSFTLSAPQKTEQYMVQILTFNDYVNPDYNDDYSLSCFLDVEPEVWYLGSEPGYQPPQIGTNVVTLTDVDIYNYYMYDMKNLYTWGSYDQANQKIDFQQYCDPDKIWIMYNNKNQAPYYKLIGNVGLNQSYTLSSSDFTQMTSYVDVSLPPNTHSYVYIESQDDPATDFWEYFMVFYQSQDSLTTVRSYYPGSVFPGYYTYISLRNNNIREYMTKYRGSIPSQFVSLPVNVNVINEGISNFSATYTGTSDIAGASWVYGEGTTTYQSFSYAVTGSMSDIGSFSAPDLPQEIKSLNPSLLDLNKLIYSGSFFRDYNFISDYNDYIQKMYIQPGFSSATMEYEYSKYIYKATPKSAGIRSDREELRQRKGNFREN